MSSATAAVARAKNPEKVVYVVKHYNYRKSDKPLSTTEYASPEAIKSAYAQGKHADVYGEAYVDKYKERNESKFTPEKLKEIAEKKDSTVIFEKDSEMAKIEKKVVGGRRKTRKTRGMTKRKTLRRRR